MAAYTVRAARCDHRADQADIDAALRRITAPLERAWQRIEAAATVGLKVNLVWPPEKIRRTAERHQELVDPAVFRGVLKLLREHTSARLVVCDTTLMHGEERGRDVHFRPLLDEFGAEYVECNDEPSAAYDLPDGLMFGRYLLHPIFRDIDAMVSVATLKSHNFMGVTLTTKNLFGLPPIHPNNRNRTYFHHIIRLPYVLADLHRLLDPALCLVDGLVGQSKREWGGEARISDTLLAGDHSIATDLCGAWLMGHDPYGDWPHPPYRRDRSHLKVAVEAGWGPGSLDEVDFAHDLERPVGEYDSDEVDAPETVAGWRRSMCEQALHFLDHREQYLSEYANQYIYLQDGEVLWHDAYPPRGWFSRRELAGAKRGVAIWLKYADPAEWEQERFDVYARELAKMEGVLVA